MLFREFILGNNSTGLVTGTSDSVSVVGGEDPSLLVGGILPGESAILFGSGTATSVFVAPSATIASWDAFFASVQSAGAAAAASGTSGAIDPSVTSAGLKGRGEAPRAGLVVEAVLVASVGYVFGLF